MKLLKLVLQQFKWLQEIERLQIQNENLRLKLVRLTLENQALRGDSFYLASFLPKGNSGFGRDYGE